MTKRFLIREEITDCNVGDVLELEDGHKVLCTERRKSPSAIDLDIYKIGEKWYPKYQLPETFYTLKEVYPECGPCGACYKEK